MDSLKLNGNICRICLDDNVTINWSEEIVEFSGISYKDCYYKYTELQQSSVDPFPTNLCETCSNGLKNTHLLFEKALESLKILQECLTTEELAQTPVSCLKKDSDVELSRSQPIMNFQIKVIENFKNKNDIFEDETLGNDKSLIDIDDEILCPINACDNDSVVEESPITNSSNVQDATIEPGHFIEMPNYDSPAEDLLEQKLSESCDKDSETFTHTKKSAKSRRNPFYICSYCSLKADSIAVLKRHEATHSENRERTETCPHCEVKLYNKMALRVHMEIHTENRQKKFKCEFCEKAFFNRGALNVHRRIHLGQMVTCRLCPKEFYRQIDLDKHLLMRHSAAPIQTKVPQLKYTVQCQYCDKTVPTTKWKEHKAAHLNQPQVKCKVCDKKFFARVKCVRHLQRVHHKTQDQYETFIHYYDDYKTRISHLMIQQQEKVQSVTN
ncbi:PR domain zinc finger protein 5-like isoform X2 [Calliphora vicina]|uniref:PR domain zinc finger protein 5-like isoform X2 n=1 Tax=Calliphora vicina TaxID=7373 RepID=UPI00325BA64A